jgi:hypothetical protein
MKLRFAEWVAKGIQASRFGWESERRKGMGWLPDWDRLVLTDFSIRGVGPVYGMLVLSIVLLWMWECVMRFREHLREWRSVMDVAVETHEYLKNRDASKEIWQYDSSRWTLIFPWRLLCISTANVPAASLEWG